MLGPIRISIPLLRRLCLFILLPAVLVAGWYLGGNRFWAKWRSNVYCSRAEVLWRNGDSLGAREACARGLKLNPDNLKGYRLLVAMGGSEPIETRLLLRSRIADLAPKDLDNLAAVAREATLAGRFILAGRALNDLLKGEGDSDRVLELGARLDAAKGERQAAASQARKLLDRKPDYGPARLIASLYELETNPASLAAIAQLVELSRRPEYRLESSRALRQAALRRADSAEAIRWAETAATDSRSEFDDLLAAADLEIKAKPQEAPVVLEKLLARVKGETASLLKIAFWLEVGGHSQSIAELERRQKELGLSDSALGILRAELLCRRKNWQELHRVVADAKWGSGEPLRLAYSARALRGLGMEMQAVAAWKEAAKGALASPVYAKALAGILMNWSEWVAEYEDFLWRAQTTSSTNLPWALEALFQHHLSRHSAPGLLRVSAAQQNADPNNEMIRNNLVYFSLLCRSALPKAHAQADALYAKYAEDPVIVSTFGLSQLLRDRPDLAMKAFEKLPQGVRIRADVAPVYAMALAGMGRTAVARALAAKLDRKRLFPEEADLLTDAGL